MRHRILDSVRGAWKVLRGKAVAIDADFERQDFVLGRCKVYRTNRYGRVCIGPRELFFRLDGTFDGTGYGICEPIPDDVG